MSQAEMLMEQQGAEAWEWSVLQLRGARREGHAAAMLHVGNVWRVLAAQGGLQAWQEVVRRGQRLRHTTRPCHPTLTLTLPLTLALAQTLTSPTP